jgi:hypothetical protein
MQREQTAEVLEDLQGLHGWESEKEVNFHNDNNSFLMFFRLPVILSLASASEAMPDEETLLKTDGYIEVEEP